jgi:malonyl CoA-acyl carrier protein transacylase
MRRDYEFPVLSFVWRAEEIGSSVVECARRSRTRAIFDISGIGPEKAAASMFQAGADGSTADVKISPADLLEPGLEEFLDELAIRGVWVELHPFLIEGDPESYLKRIEELSGSFHCFPVTGDHELITRIITRYPGIRHVALKGSEASGFVSPENIFTLFSGVRTMLKDKPDAPGLSVWGGAAVPEAAAAFLAVGAEAVVFECLHWATSLTVADDSLKERIGKIRPEHTDLMGLNLGVPCRLYNKGNSKAVKELRQFAGSLCGEEIRDEHRRFFANRVLEEGIHALNSGLERHELIPVGTEAGFAGAFAERFGYDSEQALAAFTAAVEERLAVAGDKVTAYIDSPTAAAMGTKYPFVQGAMSWITDEPAFAREVAEAGGLPTVALGLMSGEILESRLGPLPEVMGDLPYAVNVITLAENPHRDEQLAWIRSVQPNFAVIAAGEPSHAKELLDDGIDVIYIAPNEELLKLAFEAGVRFAVCEGNEAGGHVGEHSTLTLAQLILELRRTSPWMFEGRSIILAGGICNRETAFMAAMLGADAVQMGTRYLAAKEIVATGALTQLYQDMIVQAGSGDTVVTGEGTGLRVRSLRTPKIEAVCELERDFAAGSQDEASFRHQIEALSAGSLFVAARGLDKPGGAKLDDQNCREQGQFMSGACAGAVTVVSSVAELHAEIAEGSLDERLPYAGPVRPEAAARVAGVDTENAVPSRVAVAATAVSPPRPERERVAITGMAVVNSLGNSPEAVWAASMGMQTGIVEVPPSKWDHSAYYDPRPRVSEKTYCRVGAFQNIDVSRKELGIAPQDFRTMTDSTRVTMWLAKQALDDSGIMESDVPRERIGVIVSQNSGEAAATLQDVIIRGSVGNIVSSVGQVVPLTPDTASAVEEAVKAGRIAIDDTTLLGRLNCTAGGFICNKYGFMGPSFAVSAACATALVALYSAYQMIRNGIIDAAVIGGAEETLTPMHFLEFSALGALAGLSGEDRPAREASRPFDTDRDGMVLGEGGGMIVIERESVARKRGARIHALISAMGASNNHLGMVESSRVTQELAIKASFDDGYYGPDEVDLIECHATSTKQGDVEEVLALSNFFSADSPTALTSFKSQIGHTLGASGVNSLIRGVMAMKAGVIPPTLNFHRPDPEMRPDERGFSIFPEPVEWPQANGRPRRLQVNAFGFGGSNYVVQVEENVEGEDTVLVQPKISGADVTSQDVKPLPSGLFLFRTEISGSSYRLAVVADSESEAKKLIEGVDPITNGGRLPVKRLRALARQGIHLAPLSESPPPLAFVFPGQGSHYAGMSHELYESFPVIREWMDRIAEVADFDILGLLFHNNEEDLQKTRWQQPALFTMEYAMVQYLRSLGIEPAALAGHSLGELTALCLAGVYSYADGFRIVNKRAVCMDKACDMNVDPGIMIAVDAPMDVIEQKLKENDGVYITNLNSPHQIVLGGDTEIAKALGAELKEQGYRSTQLRVSMAFHSPIMRCIHDELQEFVDSIEFHPPQIPVISNTTKQPFPDDTNEIKRIVMAHLESPVHWMDNVRTLHDDYGVRLFVEVGPRDVLSNMISDTLDDAECIQTCLPSAESLVFTTAMAQLSAKGVLFADRPAPFIDFPQAGHVKSSVAAVSTAGRSRAGFPSEPKLAERFQAPPVTTHPLHPVEQIVQREINKFILESFGRFIKPGLLDAIRQEHDGSFAEEHLDEILARMFPTVPRITGAPTSPPSAAYPTLQADVKAVEAAVPDEAPQPAPPVIASSEPGDIAESVIAIIMDATGYERDEVEPDMDLREDLSIRSSRLPVIMDAVESKFGIQIDVEDFMDVRTVQDIADRIGEVMAKQGPAEPQNAAGVHEPEESEIAAERQTGVSEKKKLLKRIVFRDEPLTIDASDPVVLTKEDRVVILSPDTSSRSATDAADWLKERFGAQIEKAGYLTASSASDQRTFDFAADVSSGEQCVAKVSTASAAGLVIVTDDRINTGVTDGGRLSTVLSSLFIVVRDFLDSPSKKLVLLLDSSGDSSSPAGELAQGTLGMFLSLVHEFSSVQFRTVRLSPGADLSRALESALDRGSRIVELIAADTGLYTRKGEAAPAYVTDEPQLRLSREDVILFTGGASGITSHLAGGLAPFGCRMVFLGRTTIDPNIDYVKLGSMTDISDRAIDEIIRGTYPDMLDRELGKKRDRVLKELEIVRTVEELREQGIDASYFSCDVTDPERTSEVVRTVLARFGNIDGIVHGAGFLKDSYVKQMSVDDFTDVISVKYLGAVNLMQATKGCHLKFVVGLSSAAAIQGNPGQCNYSAGNRMMSAFLSSCATRMPDTRFKALMLPPIEGAGMAENEDIRALMKRMNAEYVNVMELSGLFGRELLHGPSEDRWVMFLRSLPDVAGMLLDQTDYVPAEGELEAGSAVFRTEDLPMIDSVSEADISAGELVAHRSFFQARDLWLPDHKPFKFLKHPLVSAIMALETFAEASRLLHPHLKICGIRDAEFLDIIECPEDLDRQSEIRCSRMTSEEKRVVCNLIMRTKEISPSGRTMDRSYANYRAKVILGEPFEAVGAIISPFPVSPHELDSRPMYHNEVLDWYSDRTDMSGRYRLMEDFQGSGPGVVRGRTTYRVTEDFAAPLKTKYQFPVYLLEALMQVVNFYIIMRDTSEQRSMIPFKIKEALFFKDCQDGQKLEVEARMKDQNDEGITWDARAVDEHGDTVMSAQDMTMRWFSA